MKIVSDSGGSLEYPKEQKQSVLLGTIANQEAGSQFTSYF